MPFSQGRFFASKNNNCLFKFFNICFVDKRRRLEFKRRMYIASQIAGVMVYLTSVNCIHRDLCAINVLMGIRDRAKIANFALAKLIEVK